jgi:TolB-like protein/tetratricopeptide (TPR) repeat protein
LAVLPFENSAGDPELEYLADGITESLIRQMSQLPKLQVMARTTMFRFKGGRLRPEAVGRRLGVGAVLAGHVLQRGDRLLIGVDLIDVHSGLQLWGEQYERPASDIVRMQQEISREIFGKLRLQVTGEVQQRISNWGTEVVAAYHLYLKGCHFSSMSFGEGFRKGIQYFLQAIDQDPAYGLAHVGLAECYGALGFYGYIPPNESWPKARAAAARALQIDESLAEGYASLAAAKLFYDWHPEAALSDCEHAIQLNPSYPFGFRNAAMCLISMCRSNEAYAMMEKAQALDPLSVWVHTVAGLIAYLGRDYDRALSELHKALELDLKAGEAKRAIGISYLQIGKVTEAIRELEEACALLDSPPFALASLGRAYGRAGLVDKAEAILSKLTVISEHRRVAAASTAAVYVGLGRYGEALQYLERAIDNRSSWLVWLNAEPWWDPLREHPRFESIRRRIVSPANPSN